MLCKTSNYDFCISQGSVATVLRWAGWNYIKNEVYVTFRRDVACQKLLKSANVSQSYSKNNTGTVFFETRCIAWALTLHYTCVTLTVYQRYLNLIIHTWLCRLQSVFIRFW